MPATGFTDPSGDQVDFTTLTTFVRIFSGTNTAPSSPDPSSMSQGESNASAGFIAPKTYCQKIIHRWGEQASEAQCIVQLDDLDSVVPCVSGTPSSPMQAIKKGDLAQVYYEDVTLFSGIVVDDPKDIGPDSALLIIKDFRYLLEGVQFMGSWWADIALDGEEPTISWTNVKAHYNPNNQPNCIFVNISVGDVSFKLPVFCSPFYGISDFVSGSKAAITIPDPSEQSTTQATYWTPETALFNALFACSQQAKSIIDGYGTFPFYAGCIANDKLMTLPYDVINAFRTIDKNPVSRKAFERVYHCVSMNKLITDLCSAAGPYAPCMQHNDDGTNTLIIGRTRYIGADAQNVFGSGAGPSADTAKGINLLRAQGGKASAEMVGPTVVAGQLRESAESFYSKVIEVGAHVVIGCRCASGLTFNAADPDKSAPLAWAFAEADRLTVKANLLDYLKTTTGPDIQGFMRGQFRQYSSLFCEYTLKPGFDFQAGTSQQGFPIAKRNRDLLPHCVSSYIPSFAGDEFARLNSRYPIPLENCAVTDEDHWLPVPDANGMAIKGRGIISLRMQRDQDLENVAFPAPSGAVAGPAAAVTYDISYHYATPGDKTTAVIDTFRPKRIRVSLGVPCDHRLVAALKTPGDPTGDMQIGNSETNDADRINGDNLVRTLAVDTGQLCAYEERGGSVGEFPVPESIKQKNGANAYPKAGTENVIYGDAKITRDDSDYMFDQADRKLREFGRLDRGGNPKAGRLELSAQVFDMIDQMENTNIGPVMVKAVRKQVEHNFVQGYTESLVV